MKQTPRVKKSLGRVWTRYFQLYGMTSKLTIACINLSWTRMDIKTYTKEHYHLVNQFTASMVRDSEPDIPQPVNLEWLTSHPAVAGTGKAPRTQVHAGQKKSRECPRSTRNSGIERNKKVSKVFRPPHMENAISETGEGNSANT